MNKTLFLLLAAALVWVLAACGPSPEQQATLTATALTATATMWTPTPTQTPTVTLTPTPTSTLTPTPTPTLTPTTTFTPTRTPDPDRYYPPGTSISLIAPEGWIPFSVDNYTGLVSPQGGDPELKPNLLFLEAQDDSDLAFFTAQLQDSISPQMPGYKQLQEDFLNTPDGLPYFRWEFQTKPDGGNLVRIVMYIFEGSNFKEILQYARPMNSDKQPDEQVEAAVQTVRFEE